MSRERELLERAKYAAFKAGALALAEEIREYLDSEKQDQPEGKCSDHPDAPHGFDRNASHNEGRYVCECESWIPEKQDQPEPVAWMWEYDALGGWQLAAGIDKPANDGFSRNVKPLYLHPAPRKPFVRLTDEELIKLGSEHVGPMSDGEIHLMVITQNALEEKNK